MTEQDHPTTSEQDERIARRVDTENISYAMARAVELGISLEQPKVDVEPVSDSTPESQKANSPKKRRYHPVSKVPDADSAYDPNWNVERPKLTHEEIAEQDALNAFGHAMVDNELDKAAKAREDAARVPKEATPEELQARKAEVNADWDRIEREIEDQIIADPSLDPIHTPPPDRRFFDPYNRKPTRD